MSQFKSDLPDNSEYIHIVMITIHSFQAEQAHFQELRALIKKYDDDKSGTLNAQELTKCIQVYSDSRHWTTDPVTPTEEEISLLLKAAGHGASVVTTGRSHNFRKIAKMRIAPWPISNRRAQRTAGPRACGADSG